MDDDDLKQQDDDDNQTGDNSIFNPVDDEDKLDNDFEPPASPAQDEPGKLPLTDPRTDSGLDDDEVYGEGLAEAAGIDDDEIGPDDSPKPLDPEE